MDSYAFTGQAGDLVLLRMSSVSGDLWAGIKIYDSGGVELCEDTHATTAEIASCELSASGTYTILADDGFDGTRTGDYYLYLQRLNNPAQANTLDFGETLAGSIESAAHMKSYTFAASAGNRVMLRMSNVSGDLWSGLRIYDSGGVKLCEATHPTTAEIASCDLTTSGNYTILAYDGFNGTFTGEYNLFLTCLTPPCDPPTPTPTNIPITSTPTPTSPSIPAAAFPLADGFESGTLGEGWSVIEEAQGAVRVSTEAAYVGTSGVLLEDSIRDETDSLAGLVLTVDLAGQSDVELQFAWREFNDENHAQDGLFISDDLGATWHKGLSFNNGSATYQQERVDLDALVAANGLSFNEHFQIKFQFYDNYPAPNDGYAIDEVRIETREVGSTPTPTPIVPDAYEEDDACGDGQEIATDGTSQEHTFHDAGDSDWVHFEATAPLTYVIEARVPPDSLADLALELYGECGGSPDDEQDNSFSADVRLTFSPPSDGSYYLRLKNQNPDIYGADVNYTLSVREIAASSSPGALILVAGRRNEGDDLQDNIYHVTNALYQFASTHGCAPDDIYYLAPDTSLDADGDGEADVNRMANNENLEYAITEWAVDKVAADEPLTIYMMDHGAENLLYLDGVNNETVTSAELDGWLAQLEASVPGVQSNIVVEACQSGSFMSQPESISGDARAVLSSASDESLAYASSEGAVFSDAFIGALKQGMNLEQAFSEGRWAAQEVHPDQSAWLDDDGDGTYSPSDGQLAAQRAFACAVAPSAELWAPYIVEAEVSQDTISAEVRDDQQVAEVWAIVYPPSYTQPDSSEELIAEPEQRLLQPAGSDRYQMTIDDFDEAGTYRVVLYAADEDGLTSRPHEVQVTMSWQLYLPAVLR